MKVALVYDRANKWGGAERVLLSLNKIFPKAPLFTSLHNPASASWTKVFPGVFPSPLNKYKYLRKRHGVLAPFMPMLFESFDFKDFDLVISVTSEAAKGIIVNPSTKHICYCLTPTRYLWSHNEEYFNGSASLATGVFKTLSKPVVSYLRRWDKVAAQRPDTMLAISTEVQSRIKKYYGRESVLIHPPLGLVDSRLNIVDGKSKKRASNLPSTNYYLLVSRLVPYKRVDLAIEAFNQLSLPLYIVGVGSEESKLKRLAGPTIKFLGSLTDTNLAHYYEDAKALILPQYEDFGLVSVEAQSFGTAVIAFKKGGSLDTVIDGITGVFFEKQNKESLIEAVKRSQKLVFDKSVIIKNSQKFSFEIFKKSFLKLIKNI